MNRMIIGKQSVVALPPIGADRTPCLITRTLDKLLTILGLQNEQHWCRVVLDRETKNLVDELRPNQFDVLEISGTKWRTATKFRSYRTVSYPEYDICEAPLNEQYDLVIAEQVWEHLVFPLQASRNVYTMLRDNGHFLITTPFLLRLHECPYDCWRWTEAGLRHHLENAGFRPDQIRTASWGNKACVIANLARWAPYRPWFHSLGNEPEFPVVVWAIARKKRI
jgi:hypothetical protein